MMPRSGALPWGLAREDPQAALAWMEAHLQSAVRADAVASVVKEAVGNNMERATALIEDMPAGGAMARIVETLVKSWDFKTVADRDRISSWVDAVHRGAKTCRQDPQLRFPIIGQ
ncbi:MAG: hypothetical protein ACI8T1_003078 [Verrucomicrobiales bacterium]|jgi:hypothetical protein